MKKIFLFFGAILILAFVVISFVPGIVNQYIINNIEITIEGIPN